MATTRSIELRQINIAMHDPHSPEGYVELFKTAYQSKRIFTWGKSDGFLIGALYNVDQAVEQNELAGEIYRFTNIDPDGEWFNLKTGEVADETELEEIVLPENLLPNLQRFPFIFRPQEHRFWYVSKDRKSSLGPGIAEAFLQKSFDQTGFPPVEVTVIPEESAVDEVFSLHRITKIVLEFKRPNMDDAADIEHQIMERMERQRVNRIHEVMTSTDPDGIAPDELLKEEARIASENGYVESYGYDSGGLQATESTKEKPAKYVHPLNETTESVWNVLQRFSSLITRRR